MFIRITVMRGGHELIAFQQVRKTQKMHRALAMCRNYRDRYNRAHPGARARLVVAVY